MYPSGWNRKRHSQFLVIYPEVKLSVTQSGGSYGTVRVSLSLKRWPSPECFALVYQTWGSSPKKKQNDASWFTSSSWSRLDVGRSGWRWRECWYDRPSWRQRQCTRWNSSCLLGQWKTGELSGRILWEVWSSNLWQCSNRQVNYLFSFVVKNSNNTLDKWRMLFASVKIAFVIIHARTNFEDVVYNRVSFVTLVLSFHLVAFETLWCPKVMVAKIYPRKIESYKTASSELYKLTIKIMLASCRPLALNHL